MGNAPWIILLAVFVYSVVHSLLATFRAKTLAQRQFGPAADRFYRLTYNIFAVVSFLPVLALVPLLPDRPLYTISMPWLVLSLAGQVMAIGLLAVGLLQTGVGTFLGLSQLVSPPEVKSQTLVVKGLYRWVRHPLYTAGLLFIWLTPAMTGNVLALIVGLSAYLFLGAMYEERKLVRVFGPEYTAYQQSTPMLIPGLRFPRRDK